MSTIGAGAMPPMRLVLLVTLVSAIPATSHAGADQTRSPGASSAAAATQRTSPDFFFGRPRASIGIRGSWTIARAGSDWFDFVTEQLTLDRHDFRAAGIAADVAVALARRLDLVVGVDFGHAEPDSEFRGFVDDDRLPIEQTTQLRHSALTMGARFALTERGREISSLAWVPRRIVPYVGAGGGAVWYRVRQEGDFVDFRDLSIFSEVIESSGWAPAGYVNAGADVHLVRHVYLTVDGRYLWAAPQLTEPWRNFDALDLAGLRLSTGVSVVF
jgi:hypothetical protein